VNKDKTIFVGCEWSAVEELQEGYFVYSKVAIYYIFFLWQKKSPQFLCSNSIRITQGFAPITDFDMFPVISECNIVPINS